MALATTTLGDDGGTTRPTGIAFHVVGPGPGFQVSIERSANGTTGWVEQTRQTFPDGAGGVWLDRLPVTGTLYYYRARAMAPGYQPSAYTAVVSGRAEDQTSLGGITKLPKTEMNARVYGALSGPSTIRSGVFQNDGANARPLVKGRQVFYARHGEVLTFVPTFQDVPKYRISGGAVYVPNTVWTVADDYRTMLGSMVSGFSTLTLDTGAFTPGDAGKNVRVVGAGVAGADLVTTISTYSSPTQVFLAASASTTVAAAVTSVYTGSLLAPLSVEQLPDDELRDLSVSGATVQARLKQKNSSLTPRLVAWSAGAMTTLTTHDVDLGTGNMPAYDDKYTVTWTVQLDTIVNNKYSPDYCETSLEVKVWSNDGGGWVLRGTYLYAGSAEGLGDHVTDNWSESKQYTVAGLGDNDDWRLEVSAFTVDGNDGGSNFSVDPSKVSWSQGTNNDRYANRTPDAEDFVVVEVEAA